VTLAAFLDRVPDTAKDLRLNLSTLIERGSLPRELALTVALACARAARAGALETALRAEAAGLPPERLAAAETAAALMGMTNVFYRFKKFAKSEEYDKTPAGLRMTALARPGIPKAEMELVCLAVSAVNGCESCVASHDRAVREAGTSATQVLDAVRIAATVAGLAAASPPP
jgi:alkyl hydroperoxide reductase subunit D